MLVEPGVHIKAVKGNALLADWDFGDEWTHLGVEPIPVHAQVRGCVFQPDGPGE
jgi:hypothetical protein